MTGGWTSLVLGLHHTGLFVTDLTQSRAFFHDVLGMTVDLELARPGLRVAMLRSGAGRLELLEVTPTATDDRRTPGLRHVAFEVIDVDAAYQTLSANGTRFLEPPFGGVPPWPRACFFRAADGTLIELLQPAVLMSAGTYDSTQ